MTPKPILKVSLSFVNYSNARLLIFVNGVLAGFLTNTFYPNPKPLVVDMETLRDEFSTAIDNARYGGTHLNNIKRDKRNLVILALRNWAYYVNINNFNYDRSTMETSGFKIIGGPRVTRDIPDNITSLVMELGKLNGTVKATVNVVDIADYYLLRYKVVGDLENPNWRYHPASSSSRMLITGLPTGAIIEAQALAGNSQGQGNWSGIVTFKYVL